MRRKSSEILKMDLKSALLQNKRKSGEVLGSAVRQINKESESFKASLKIDNQPLEKKITFGLHHNPNGSSIMQDFNTTGVTSQH
jgi:hypothetical protein